MAVYAKGNRKWQFYNLSAEDSGIIKQEELEEIRKNTPAEIYNQEYRALFTDDGASPFRNVRQVCSGQFQEPKRGHWYQMGVDLARKQDFTVLTILDICCDQVTYIERFNEINWPYQKTKIEAIARRYADKNGNPARINMDSSGLGDPVYQDLTLTSGLHVAPIQFTLLQKQQLVENAMIRFDNKSITCPRYQTLIDELETFESKKTKNGKITYGAPNMSGMCDDSVISLCLALWNPPKVKKSEGKDRKTMLMDKYKELNGLNRGPRYSDKSRQVCSLSDL